MRQRHAFFFGAGLAACALLFGQSAPAPRPSLAEPSLSPDGRTIVFASGGDIWTAPSGGGTAHLLVSHPATESRPLFSPDGKRLAFASNRTGNGDIYVLTLDTGELKRLTYDDSDEKLDAWSPDGKWIYFSSNGRDISGMNDVYRVSSEGGTPMPVTADRYASEFFSAPSPDGQAIAFTARGIASTQWWRKGSSHLDESEIWVKRDGRYERLTPPGARQMWPMWSSDGKTVYFMSDRGGTQNLWVQAGDRPLPGAHAFHKRPRPVADTLLGWKDDRLRAELRPLEMRHGDRRGGRDSDHSLWGSGRPGRRAPFARAPDRRARRLAGRKEVGLCDSRRDLRCVRQGRRRRGPRDPDERQGVADRLGA